MYVFGTPLISSYKAIKKSTEEVFAVKVTSVSNLVDIRNELVLQKICNCEHVMKVYDCFNWEGNLWVSPSALSHGQIVMDYMGNGSLARIVSPETPFPESHIAYVCRNVLDALAYLHNNQQIHRGTFCRGSFPQTSRATTSS